MEDKKKILLIGGGVLVLLIFVIAFWASRGDESSEPSVTEEVTAENPLPGDESEPDTVDYVQVGDKLVATSKTKADERDYEAIDWGDEIVVSQAPVLNTNIAPQTLENQDIISITSPEAYLYNPSENYYMIPLSVAKEKGVDFALSVTGGTSYLSLGNNLILPVDGTSYNFKYSIPGVYNIAVTNQEGPITKKSKTILLRVGQVQASFVDSRSKKKSVDLFALNPILLKAKAETPVGQVLQYYWTCDVLSSAEVQSCESAIHTDPSLIEALTGAREDTDNLAVFRPEGSGAFRVSLQVSTNLGFSSDFFSRVYRIYSTSLDPDKSDQ